jgi:hypothetical protein
VLLQDTEAGNYRWSDDMFYQALNAGLLETRKFRPEFYRGFVSTPQYDPTDVNTSIAYPEEYRPALIDYVCGGIQLQDYEATDDSRAAQFLAAFAKKLTMAVA